MQRHLGTDDRRGDPTCSQDPNSEERKYAVSHLEDCLWTELDRSRNNW